jgi:hypothetical protein
MELPLCRLCQWAFSFRILMTFLTAGHVGIFYDTAEENGELVFSHGMWETYGSSHNRQDNHPPVAGAEKLGMT